MSNVSFENVDMFKNLETTVTN